MSDKWNADYRSLKISDDTHKMLMIIKQAYQNKYKRNITFNEIITQILVGGIDDRINVVMNECL